jgi:hypothetical protein
MPDPTPKLLSEQDQLKVFNAASEYLRRLDPKDPAFTDKTLEVFNRPIMDRMSEEYLNDLEGVADEVEGIATVRKTPPKLTSATLPRDPETGQVMIDVPAWGEHEAKYGPATGRTRERGIAAERSGAPLPQYNPLALPVSEGKMRTPKEIIAEAVVSQAIGTPIQKEGLPCATKRDDLCAPPVFEPGVEVDLEGVPRTRERGLGAWPMKQQQQKQPQAYSKPLAQMPPNESMALASGVPPSVSQGGQPAEQRAIIYWEPAITEVIDDVKDLPQGAGMVKDLEEKGRGSDVWKQYSDLKWKRIYEAASRHGNAAVRIEYLKDPTPYEKYLQKAGLSVASLVSGVDEGFSAGVLRAMMLAAQEELPAEKELRERGILKPLGQRVQYILNDHTLARTAGNFIGAPAGVGKALAMPVVKAAEKTAGASLMGRMAGTAPALLATGGAMGLAEGTAEQAGIAATGGKFDVGRVAAQAGTGALAAPFFGWLGEVLASGGSKLVTALNRDPNIGRSLQILRAGTGGKGTALPGMGYRGYLEADAPKIIRRQQAAYSAKASADAPKVTDEKVKAALRLLGKDPTSPAEIAIQRQRMEGMDIDVPPSPVSTLARKAVEEDVGPWVKQETRRLRTMVSEENKAFYATPDGQKKLPADDVIDTLLDQLTKRHVKVGGVEEGPIAFTAGTRAVLEQTLKDMQTTVLVPKKVGAQLVAESRHAISFPKKKTYRKTPPKDIYQGKYEEERGLWLTLTPSKDEIIKVRNANPEWHYVPDEDFEYVITSTYLNAEEEDIMLRALERQLRIDKAAAQQADPALEKVMEAGIRARARRGEKWAAMKDRQHHETLQDADNIAYFAFGAKEPRKINANDVQQLETMTGTLLGRMIEGKDIGLRDLRRYTENHPQARAALKELWAAAEFERKSQGTVAGVRAYVGPGGVHGFVSQGYDMARLYADPFWRSLQRIAPLKSTKGYFGTGGATLAQFGATSQSTSGGYKNKLMEKLFQYAQDEFGEEE